MKIVFTQRKVEIVILQGKVLVCYNIVNKFYGF